MSTKIEAVGNKWTVSIWSSVAEMWIVQGEWLTREDAERDAANWN